MNRIEELQLDLKAAIDEAAAVTTRLKEIDRQIQELEAEKKQVKERKDRLEYQGHGIIPRLKAGVEDEIRKENDLQKPKAVISDYKRMSTPDMRVTRVTPKRIYCREPGKKSEVYYDLKTGESSWDGTLDVVATLTVWKEYKKKLKGENNEAA